MSAKFIVKSSGDQFRFNLLAGNGQAILSSEAYKKKASAKNGIESVRKNAADDARFDRRTAKNGQAYFVLKAGNGEIIGQSQMYKDTASMEKGIASVMENAPKAQIEEQI